MPPAPVMTRPDQAAPMQDQRPLGRRERNKLEKRARIVAAARQLFAAQGFAETTTQQIAEAADIGTGTLFLYARSKEDLLFLVFKDEMQETAQESFRQIPPDMPIIDQALAVFGRMVDYHERDLELTRNLLREILMPVAPGREADLEELMNVIFGGFAELVRVAQAKGQLSGRHDPWLTGQSIFAIYYLSLVGWVSGRTKREAFFQQLRQQLGMLLATPE